MGLLSLLKKMRKKEGCLLILGLDNAGKTSILKQLAGEDPNNIEPTRGFNVKSIMSDGVNLNVWDIGGQTSIRQFWRNYYEKADALIWVIDSSDTKRMEETGMELDTILKDEKLANVPVMIFANKQDLLTAETPDNISKTLNLDGIKTHKWRIQGCSAKNGTGLKEGMEWISKQATTKK